LQALAALKTIEDPIQLSSYNIAIQRTVKNFKEFCETRAFGTGLPVTIVPLGAFLVFKFNQLQGSAKSIRIWVNHLRSYSVNHNLQWLGLADVNRLNSIIKQLEYLDLHPTRRMQPLTHEVEALMIKQSKVSEFTKLIIKFAREGLFRGGEVCSDLQTRKFIWMGPKRVTIHLDRSKANRKGNGEDITLVDYGPSSAVALLRAHFDKYKLWKNSESLVFPSYTKTKGLDWSKGLAVNQMRTLIKDAAAKAGLDPKMFGAHSPRAGGATDLFRLGVYYPNIKKFGRWKSDTALIYYRDQEAVTETVMTAFRSLSNLTK
jgi:hypothetical protein